MALHSVWGAAAPPGTYGYFTDGTPSIWTGQAFYRTASGTPVTAVAGARLWVTSASLAANSSVTIRIFRGDFAGGANTLADVDAGFAAPIATKTMALTGVGWNEVLFDSTVTCSVGELIYLVVQYSNPAGYSHSGTLGSGGFVLAENGMGFCLAEATELRSVFKIGTGGFDGAINYAIYGLDAIFDDGAGGGDTTPPSVPTGLNITSITHNSATANWTASTDDVGVTGYEVFRGGVSQGTTAATSFNLTGLAPSTLYSITVRARDAAGNWSAQSGAVTFTTGAATIGGSWLNHVTIAAPPNGTTSHTVTPSAGTVLAGSLFTPTAGRFLVCVTDSGATSSTPTGWTLPANGDAVNHTGLYMWYRAAAGGDGLTTTHNGSNRPAVFDFYEFPAASTFVAAVRELAGNSGQPGPALSGLSGTNWVLYAMARGITGVAGSASAAWATGVEAVDALTPSPDGTVDGYHYSAAALVDFTGASTSSVVTLTNGIAGASTIERLAFAVAVVDASGDTQAPSVPANVQVTPGQTTATVTWDPSTDNVGVTSYEVSIGGTPVGAPTATTLNVTGLSPSTTYTVTVRARDSAANWSASSTPVEFTTQAATRLTIAQENALAGTDRAWWYDLGGPVGDTANVGYARTFSNEVGTTVQFCCSGGGTVLQIYRLGWYGGAGARLVDTVTVTPQVQAGPTTIPSSNNGVQFSGWAVNASWAIPAVATSGFYLGVYRNAADNNASWIPFIVKDAARVSDVVYKTSDTSWMIAYNHYGGPSSWNTGGSFYGAADSMGGGGITTRAHACSYHRPYVTRAGGPLTAWSNAELPMIRWVERMGYEVKYVGSMDLHDSANCLAGAKVFVSVGHDEYWSTQMRDNVEAFRDGGGHLAFFSGNEVFWRIRRDGTDPNIIWCYKDTMPGPGGHVAGVPLDPVTWTGTWKDTRWAQRRPENLTTGTDFRMNASSSKTTTFDQAAGYADHPVWRNSALAAGTSQSVLGIVGFEADDMLPVRPNPSVLAAEVYNIDANRADDNGQNYNGNGSLNWGVVAQRYPSGAVVVGFGTVQWSWGLDTMHDATNASGAANPSMQQFTYNLFRDLGANAATPHTGIVTSSPVALLEYGGPIGTATGAVAWAGAATGDAPDEDTRSGSATGAVSWVGAAVGLRAPVGTASGAYVFAGTANGPASIPPVVAPTPRTVRMTWLDATSPKVRSAVVSGSWGRLPHSEHFAVPPSDPDEIDVIEDALAQASEILTGLTAGTIHPALQVVEDFVCYPTVARLSPSLQPLRRVVGLYVITDDGPAASLSGVIEHGGNVRFIDADAVTPTGYAWTTLDGLMFLQLQCRCPDLQRLRLTYDVGSTITASARQAVVSLAHELYLRVSPCEECGACRLPLRTTSVTREGISYNVGDPVGVDQPGGATGLPDVDIWLRSVNPRRAHQASAVYTAEAPPPVVRSLVTVRNVFPPLLASSVTTTATTSAAGVVA